MEPDGGVGGEAEVEGLREGGREGRREGGREGGVGEIEGSSFPVFSPCGGLNQREVEPDGGVGGEAEVEGLR